MGSHKKIGNFNPKIHKPRPEDNQRLTEWGEWVKVRHKKVTETSRPEPNDVLLVCTALLTGKVALRHGAYSWWVREYCGMSARTGRRYIQRLRWYLEVVQGLDFDLIVEDLKDLSRSLARRAAKETAQGKA